MSGLKETMKHATIYSVASILGKMVGFLMLPFYAHILRDNGYAVIGMLDAGSALLISLLAHGVRGANIRFYHDQVEADQKKAVISTGMMLILAVTTVLIAPLMIFSRPISGLLLDNPDYSHLMIMSLITFLFQMGGEGASSWFLIRRQSFRFSTITLLRLVMALSLNIWLILIKGMGLNGYFISAMATSILCNSIIMIIVLRECGSRFDRSIAIELRDFLLPLVPGNLVSFVSSQIERFLVKFKIDLSSVGILEMAYRFPILLAMFITTPFQKSWETRRFEIADEPGAERRIGEMLTFYLFLMTFAGLLLAVIIKPLIAILTPPEFHSAFRIARVEIITTIFSGLYYQVAFGLFYAKHTRTLALIRGWTSAVKVLLAWSFITLWGIAGAAWSAAIISVVSVVVCYHYSQKQYRLHMEWRKIFVICGVAAVMFTMISRWDPTTTMIYRTVNGHWLPAINQLIGMSALGNWKDGKITTILADRSTLVTMLLIKGMLAVLFGLLIVYVHDGTKRKLLARLKLRI